MDDHTVHQSDHMTTIEAHAVSQVHVSTYTEHSMLSPDEDSPSSPDDDTYDDSDILNSAGADEVTAHLAAAGTVSSQSKCWILYTYMNIHLTFLEA